MCICIPGLQEHISVICKVDQTLLDGGWLERQQDEVERLSVCRAVVRLDAVEGALHVRACTCEQACI